MMRKSGVRSLVNLSKLAREMLRLAASGHIPATQDSNLAAAARMALACMSGWPDEPDSPLHSFGGVGVAAGADAWAVTAAGLAPAPRGIGRINRSGCARPGAATLSSSTPPSINRVNEAECFGICHFAERIFAKPMGTASL